MKMLSFAKSVRVRKRGKKLYLTVVYRDDARGYENHRAVGDIVRMRWPNAYSTSGGPSGCTYRLNP